MRREHGVSQSILERTHALLQQEGLIERRERMGVFVCDHRASKTKRSHGAIALAGLRGWHVGTSYHLQLVAGVQDVLGPAGVNFTVINSDSAQPTAWEKVDGLLLCEPNAKDFRHIASRRPPGMACISLMVPADEFENIRSVTVADAQALRTLTEYLLSLGHHRIAYLASVSDMISQHRVLGYRQALEAAGIAPQPSWIRKLFVPDTLAELRTTSVYQRAERTMREWLQDGWRELGCTALLVQNDDAAAAVMDVLQENGLQVPGDVSVAGFDGIELPAHPALRLTTIEVPLRRIGRHAAQLLLNNIHERDADDGMMVFPAPLRIGNTTAKV
jgi:DNA-binding LacI/PurR family transcriptional regulator